MTIKYDSIDVVDRIMYDVPDQQGAYPDFKKEAILGSDGIVRLKRNNNRGFGTVEAEVSAEEFEQGRSSLEIMHYEGPRTSQREIERRKEKARQQVKKEFHELENMFEERGNEVERTAFARYVDKAKRKVKDFKDKLERIEENLDDEEIAYRIFEELEHIKFNEDALMSKENGHYLPKNKMNKFDI